MCVSRKDFNKKVDALESKIKLWNKACSRFGVPFLVIDPATGKKNDVLGWVLEHDRHGFVESKTTLPEAKFRSIN